MNAISHSVYRRGWVVALLLAGCAGTATSPSIGEYVDDGVISGHIKTRLFYDPVVSAFQVQVETYRRQVQLSGFVDTAEQKVRAEEIARTVPGISEVRNDLIVKSK
jgi:osmotically-inducible protein OsmY